MSSQTVQKLEPVQKPESAQKVEMVRIDKIRIINGRSRNREKFGDIVDNIGKVGLKKPITVSRRHAPLGNSEQSSEADGFDLVCGQGRLEAYIACGAQEIPALIVDVPMEELLLRSLVENLTRRSWSGKEMARELVALEERGYSTKEIAERIGLTEGYVDAVLRMLKKGEERLVAAVERGEIPIGAALKISSVSDKDVQSALQDAYESGELRGKSLLKARRLVDLRRVSGKDLRARAVKSGASTTPKDLIRALRKETQKQDLLVRKARVCEQQLRFVVSALKQLTKDEGFVSLLRQQKLDVIPKHLSEMIQE
jgi:ParB family chromosome partitioning protein